MNDDIGEQGEKGLRHGLWSLRRFLPQLVLIGGWVPYLYRRYGGFSEWTSDLSGTTELDLLIAWEEHEAGGDTLADALRRAGFEERGAGAVWESTELGARIEFMTIHRGTAGDLGTVIRLEHAGLGAVALDGLTLLSEFTISLNLPVANVDDMPQAVDVRLPTLGAYVLNKAVTFPYRPGHAGDGTGPRSAKDILYLRDLVAAGEEVVERMSGDIAAIRSRGFDGEVDRARSNVNLLIRGELRRHIIRAAEMLGERDGTPQSTAEADVEGHMTDLLELLEGFAG